MTAGRRTRKTPAVRRDEIRTAARTIALESGLSAVTQRAVAEQVGIAPGLITHYVDRMDLLVAEIFRDIAREELEQVRAAVDAVSGDVDRVLVLLRELIGDYRRDVALVWVDGWSLSRRSDDLAAVLTGEARAWEAFVGEVLERGHRAGALHAPDPLALARFVVGATDGLSAQAAVWAGYERETLGTVVRTVAGLLRIPAEELRARGY
ncbi:TetR/AcrR family transcriptional regulator [Agrococcus carbonis]|uniref:Regulatory protein, tetR family n=1 Tax=Agrococcus carbonis TaxID=684552 RepID=A0A1H1LUK2_9MICO|nr:TetR family transcriptional regulator C-terminal domain-containing protein [Agrococcus carbonis]SDR78318.1 regulatory protein, tetR family [Agrococcus carbonis]